MRSQGQQPGGPSPTYPAHWQAAPTYGVSLSPHPPPLQLPNHVPTPLVAIPGDSGTGSYQTGEPDPGSAEPHTRKSGNNKFGLKGTEKCFRCRKYGRKVHLFLYSFLTVCIVRI